MSVLGLRGAISDWPGECFGAEGSDFGLAGGVFWG